jgi:hypothetical protein
VMVSIIGQGIAGTSEGNTNTNYHEDEDSDQYDTGEVSGDWK